MKGRTYTLPKIHDLSHSYCRASAGKVPPSSNVKLPAQHGASATPTGFGGGVEGLRVGRTGSVLRDWQVERRTGPVLPAQEDRQEDRAGLPCLIKSKRAFTLLEVVLSLAVFAIIVVPAIGLVALSYRNTDTSQQAPNAVEIKSLLELELRGAMGVFDSTFLDSAVVFYASQDLDEIEALGGGSMEDSDRYYRITVTEPEPAGSTYNVDDPNRVFLFNIIWPAYLPGSGANNESNLETLEQLIIPGVLSK